jgi:hypothetical protein
MHGQDAVTMDAGIFFFFFFTGFPYIPAAYKIKTFRDVVGLPG